MMVIDEMEPADRCRYAGCSKQSNREAKRSKNYMYSLEIHVICDDRIFIDVEHGKYEGEPTGYTLEFERYSEKKYMKYCNSSFEKYWSIELGGSTDLVEYSTTYFQNMLHSYQYAIKQLGVYHSMYHDDKLKNFKYEVQRLTNLESLKIDLSSNILDLIHKTRKPLEKLEVYGKGNDRVFSYDEISRIQSSLLLPSIKLNYQQFLQLSATHIQIHIGDLTEKDILNLIRSWQNGTIGKDSFHWSWQLEGSIFDQRKLLGFLGVYDKNPDEKTVSLDVYHHNKEGRKGKLFCEKTRIIFKTYEDGYWNKLPEPKRSETFSLLYIYLILFIFFFI